MTTLSLNRTIAALLIALALTSLVFMAAPQLDLQITALFFQNGTFAAAKTGPISALRYALWDASLAVAALSLGAVLLGYARGLRVLGLLQRDWNIIWWGFALGPGLLVNAVLKTYSGRARPRDVAEFGGEALFTPMGQIAQQCAADCSFVSGEVAGTTATAIALLIVLHHHSGRLPRAAVWAAQGAIAAAWAFVAWQRIASGGHFASDAAMAALLTALVFTALARVWPQPR